MSKYTTEIRYICETANGLEHSKGEYNVEEIIQNSLAKIFDFDYPIFDESYRNVLETKIIKHYYTREIGFETVGLFKLKLNAKLNEIMPYYNKLYESELLKFNPFYDVDLHTEHNRTNDGTTDTVGTVGEVTKGKTVKDTDTEQNVNGTSHTRTVESGNGENHNTYSKDGNGDDKSHSLVAYADTPQGEVTDLQSYKYLTNATDTVAESDYRNHENGKSDTNYTDEKTTDVDNIFNTNSKGNGKEVTNSEGNRNVNSDSNVKMKNLEEYAEYVYGKRGGTSYSKMLLEFRETFINIDVKIIRELNDLFLNLW